MSTDTVTTLLALLALACNALVVVVVVAWALRRRHPDAWAGLTAALGPVALGLEASIAVVASLGSLYLSEIADFPPCRLCWYQRIGMYPLAVVLVIAALRRDTRAWPYPTALAALALPVSLYHVLLERYPSLETGACEVANPCSVVWVRHFGIVTIPYMAASGFAAVLALCAVAVAADRADDHADDRDVHDHDAPEAVHVEP